jgi:hypothetical protein
MSVNTTRSEFEKGAANGSFGVNFIASGTDTTFEAKIKSKQ